MIFIGFLKEYNFRCVNHYISTEEDCLLANGTFYYPSQTKEKCESYTFCWTPQSTVTGLLSPTDEDGLCPNGGVLQSLFEWVEPQWIGGSWAFTNWTRRQAVSANTIKMTTNFTFLQTAVQASSALSLKTFLQNEVSSSKPLSYL
jgi:hypothetical protein